MTNAYTILIQRSVDMSVAKKTYLNLMIMGCAALLISAPWAFGFGDGYAATWNACLSGGVIAIAVLAAFAGVAVRLQETVLGLGLWVALSPMVVGFVRDETATLIHMFVGLVLVSLVVTRLTAKARPMAESRTIFRAMVLAQGAPPRGASRIPIGNSIMP
jgi:SPW repeat